jgi:fructose/tagatose bisphosphate aldolase
MKVCEPLGTAVAVNPGPNIQIVDSQAVKENIEAVVREAIFGRRPARDAARWAVRALAVEAGAYPASIHELYLARGRGEVRDDFTVPAINLRAITFFGARAVFRAAIEAEAKAIIFEIARSEMGYTDQRPSEYATSVLGAAIAEGYQGPVFIQGDHFQVSASRYADSPEIELQAVKELIKEAIAAGFYNIDIDTSTLVDLSKPTIPEQQRLNFSLCAEFAECVRENEPQGVTISLGGEIGEVGGQNSTEPELRGFMQGFDETFAVRMPDEDGLSKISIQTGTSHGGVVLPDGSIADVNIDFETLAHLSQVAKEFGMGGAVQHGASTLPQQAFTRFAEAGALEVHLATNFQNILYDRLPDPIRAEMYAYLEKNHADERKPDQTEEQFYYKTRKRAIGPFKRLLWDLPEESRLEIETAWEAQFRDLFERLNVGDTCEETDRFISPIRFMPPIGAYLGTDQIDEDVSDLAD